MGALWGYFVDVIGIVLAAAATVIAVIEVRQLRYSRRLETFHLLYKALATDQRRIQKLLRDFYAERYAEDQNIVISHLYYRKDWVPAPGCLVPIGEVKLQAGPAFAADHTAVHTVLKKEAILPLTNRSLVDNLLAFTDIRIFDLPAYGVAGIQRCGGAVQLTVRRGTYFDYLNTCFPFGYEAARCLLASRMRPVRQHALQMHERFDVFSFQNRFASIGTVTMTVLCNVKAAPSSAPADYFLLHKRNGNVAESKGVYDAVPAGTFQPSSENAGIPLAEALEKEHILHTIVREFGEEIFADEEFSALSRTQALERSPLMAILRQNTYFVGGGIDPINTHYILLGLAVLDFSTPAVQQVFGSDTLAGIQGAIRGSCEGEVRMVPFTSQMLYHYAHHYNTSSALRELCSRLGGENFDAVYAQIHGRPA